LKLWDLDHGICVGTMVSLGHPAFCLAVDWQSGRALSGSWDRALKVWDLKEFECLSTLGGSAEHVAPACLAMDWPTSRAISGTYDGGIAMWDLQERAQAWSAEGHDGKVSSLDVLWAEHRLLSGGADGSVKLWSFADAAVGAVALWSLAGHRSHVSGVALDAFLSMAMTTSWDGSLKVWHLDGGSPPSAAAKVIEMAAAAPVTCLDVDWPGKTAVGGVGRALLVWDLEARGGGEAVHSLFGHEDAVSCVSVEPRSPP